MTLQERRNKLVEETLMEAKESLQEIMKIKNPERMMEFCFKFGNESHCSFNVSGGTVISGVISIKIGMQPPISYSISSFPIIFLHYVSHHSQMLMSEIEYLASNSSRISLSIIDSFITKLNSILSVISDPRFTDIDISSFINTFPLSASCHLVFKNGNCLLKIKDYPGFEEKIMNNIEDPTLLRAVEHLLKRVIKNLKYLRCDASTWDIPSQ